MDRPNQPLIDRTATSYQYVDLSNPFRWMFVEGEVNPLTNLVGLWQSGENNGNGTIAIADANKLIFGLTEKTIVDFALVGVLIGLGLSLRR